MYGCPKPFFFSFLFFEKLVTMWVHGFVMLLICTGTITLQQFWGFFEILVLYFLKYEFDKKKIKKIRGMCC